MRHFLLLIGAFAIATLVCQRSALRASDDVQRGVELRTEIEPLLREHCFDCHSGSEADAGLALDYFDTPLSFLKGKAVWEKALQKLQILEMPPPEVSSLTAAERQKLLDWITATIDEFECGLTPNPGQVTLRRLNATEYQNTIRDLLGVNYTPAADFPGDDVGYGFDNIGDVLTLPPILMEKYLIAAERISRYAIAAPPPARHFEAAYLGAQLEIDGGAGGSTTELVITSNRVATFNEQVPWSGVFELTISASGDQAGSEACGMGVAVDGKMVRRLSVANERAQPKEFSVPLRLRAGRREVSIGFLNDFYVEAKGDQPKQDRNLVIHQVVLSGKKAASQSTDPSQLSDVHRAIIFTRPASDAVAEEATRKVVERLASRAFRRPVARDDLQRLVDLALSVQDEGESFEESIQIALQAILISPKFLFRVEPPSAQSAFSEFRDLDEFELATRLSYFLWSSMPDAELLSLAWKNQLRQGDNLRLQVKRMLRDPRSNAFVQNFASQWLTLRKLETFQPNRAMFPKWNEHIKELAERETLTFFAGVMRYDMSVLRLLDADFTYLNEELAVYYGIPGVAGDKFREVSLKGSPRAGLLTQASVLAVTSNPTRTSPVKRGKWILDNLLASPPPPAPAGVPELKEKGTLQGTLRQRLEQHRADPACASCHKLMDPLGFALENFDAVGIYREVDAGEPIDATGILPDGSQVVGASQLRQVLVENNQEKFVECLTEKMLTYALGRGLEYYDKCAVDKIIEALRRDDYRFSTLLIGIVSSDPFQKKGERELTL